jgi:hypothetical protein
MNNWFVVPNLDEFVYKARAIVFNNFGNWNPEDTEPVDISDVSEKDQEEFDKLLSHNESLVIIKEFIRKEKNKRTKKIRYVLSDEIFENIITKLNDRMVSNIMAGLVSKGLVESAFDETVNDFVFWVKDEHKTDFEKPETD